MLDATASYGRSLDFIVFFGYFHKLLTIIHVSEVLYLHQTFTDCVSDKCTHFDMSNCKMWLQVMEGSPGLYSISFRNEAKTRIFQKALKIALKHIFYYTKNLIKTNFIIFGCLPFFKLNSRHD